MLVFDPFEVDLGLVIWDFDGTILQTELPAFAAAARQFARHGAEIDREVWQRTLGTADGVPWWETLRQQVGGFDETDDELLEQYRAYKDELTDAEDCIPGVREMMELFDAAGLPAAVASSSPRSWLDHHLPRLGLVERFPVVITRDDVGPGRTKPHPDLFLLAADRSGVEPERCLVIEDSHHGVVAAKAANMHVIAVPHELTQDQDFTLADRVVTTLQELL